MSTEPSRSKSSSGMRPQPPGVSGVKPLDAEAKLASLVTRREAIEIWNSIAESGLTLPSTLYRFAALIWAKANGCSSN